MHSLLGAIMCSQDYNYGQSSYGRCTATGCRCPSMLYLLSGAECTCSSRRGLNRWPDSGRVLYACAPRCSKDLALRMQCVRNTERNRAPLSRFLGFNMTCMAGADREPFWLPRKACMPVQMTVSQNRVKPVHLGLDLTLPQCASLRPRHLTCRYVIKLLLPTNVSSETFSYSCTPRAPFSNC